MKIIYQYFQLLYVLKKKEEKIIFCCLDSKIQVKIFKRIISSDFDNFDKYYNYIYNLMNDYINKYVNDKNTKYSILF